MRNFKLGAKSDEANESNVEYPRIDMKLLKSKFIKAPDNSPDKLLNQLLTNVLIMTTIVTPINCKNSLDLFWKFRNHIKLKLLT